MLALGDFREMQRNAGRCAVGVRCEVHRTRYAAQTAADAFHTLRRIACETDSQGELAHLLLHRGGKGVIAVGLNRYLLHGGEQPTKFAADAIVGSGGY